jgi:hypothetical protein
MALRDRRKHVQFGTATGSGGFLTITPDDFSPVQAKIFGIGPNETRRISRTRKVMKTTLLNGLEID